MAGLEFKPYLIQKLPHAPCPLLSRRVRALMQDTRKQCRVGGLVSTVVAKGGGGWEQAVCIVVSS